MAGRTARVGRASCLRSEGTPGSLGDELRAVVRDDPGPRFRALLLGSLQDDLDISLRHPLPPIPVDNVPTVAVQDAAEIIEHPADVETGNVDRPVLMSRQRLV